MAFQLRLCKFGAKRTNDWRDLLREEARPSSLIAFHYVGQGGGRALRGRQAIPGELKKRRILRRNSSRSSLRRWRSRGKRSKPPETATSLPFKINNLMRLPRKGYSQSQ